MASASTGYPEIHMSDVIDSLKRLERIGAENSKTTEKLVVSAREIAEAILEQFQPFDDDETIQVAKRIGRNRRHPDITFTDEGGNEVELTQFELDYYIQDGKLVNRDDGRYVGKNRETSLRFAEDIADGLLDVISKVLAERGQESAERLLTLDSVKPALGIRPRPTHVIEIQAIETLLNKWVLIQPIEPLRFRRDLFRVMGINEAIVELQKQTSRHHVYVPLVCITQIIPASPAREATLVLDGKIEWIEDQKGGCW